MSIPAAETSSQPDLPGTPALEILNRSSGACHAVPSGATLEHLTVALVALYAGFGSLVYQRFGIGSYVHRLLQPELWTSLLYLIPLGAFYLLLYHRLAARSPDGRKVRGLRDGWRAAWQELRNGAFSGPRLSFLAVAAVSLALFFNAFTAWKTMIPAVHPFSQDLLLEHVDALLHGGAPYRLVNWLPLVPIDRIYFFGWGEVLMLALVVLAWRAETRILLALALTWIVLGTVVAMAVSSAGPPYFLALTGSHEYADLFAHLADAKGGPLLAPQIQHNLWSIYRSGTMAAGSGISAFPSMHVAVPALLAFATWRRSRTLSLVLAAFTAVVLLSSVALGWHYAVDGYASIIGAGAIWMLVARLPVRAAFGESGGPAPGRTAA